MSKAGPVSIRECFGNLADPRREHMRLHNLWDIIAVTILAVIAGADSWVEVAKYGVNKFAFLKTFLELPNGIPSHDTFCRVFTLVNPGALQAAFVTWVQGYPSILATRSRGLRSVERPALDSAAVR